MLPEPETFAEEWISSWNSHDLDRILDHYADDVEITSPMIEVALGRGSGTLHGKDALRAYWATALEKFPDLRFELIACAAGVDSIALSYRSVMDKLAIEVMFFNEAGKVRRMAAHYD